MSRTTFSLLAALPVLTLVFTASSGAADKSTTKEDKGHGYPHMHRALRELKGAHKELKESSTDFGGNKEKAIKSVDAAMKTIEQALKGHKLKELPPMKSGKKSDHYPHMHHALHDLHGAHKELKEAKDNFGGHREAALKDVDNAIKAIEACLKHAGAGDKKKS